MMKNKMAAAASKAIAAAKAELWGEDQPESPKPAAAGGAATAGRDQEIDFLDSKVSNLHERLEELNSKVNFMAAKVELWDEDQPGSPNPSAAIGAATPGRGHEVKDLDYLHERFEDLNSKVNFMHNGLESVLEDLNSKVNFMHNGLESVLGRMAHLERGIHNKEKTLGVGLADRLMGPNRLKKAQKSNERVAELARGLWGEEEKDAGREEEQGSGTVPEPEFTQQWPRPNKKRKGTGGGEGGVKKKPY